MTPRHRSAQRETIVEDGAVLAYDHRAERYELIHYHHNGLEATIGFVAVDVGDQDFRLLRRRELGAHAKGYEVEGRPAESFGEAIGSVLEAIGAGDHPEVAVHAQ